MRFLYVYLLSLIPVVLILFFLKEKYYSKSDIFWLKQVEWMGMCYPINPQKRAAAKGATRTEIGYKNMMEMIE